MRALRLTMPISHALRDGTGGIAKSHVRHAVLRIFTAFCAFLHSQMVFHVPIRLKKTRDDMFIDRRRVQLTA